MIGGVVEGNNHPMNPINFREGTSRFSLKSNNDWWYGGHAQLDNEALLMVTHCIDFVFTSCL